MGAAKFGDAEFVIPAPNLLAAKSFYENVFGWTVESPAGTRAHFKSEDFVGTFFSGARPKQGVVVVHLWVSNAKKHCDLIKRHGGTIVGEPIFLGQSRCEYMAWFHDPNGNLGCLKSAKAQK